MKFQLNRSILYLFFSFLFFLTSCDSTSKKPIEPIHFNGNEMTIDYHITIGQSLDIQNKKKVEKIIQATFLEINAVYNKWNPFSEISSFNRLSANTPLLLSPSLYQFLQRIDTFVKLSENRFDPTIEPLHQLWKKKLEQNQLPSFDERETIKSFVGWDKIHLFNGYASKDHSECQIDLGGIAKGLCVDLLIERLYAAGFHNLFVEWGGEIRVKGIHPSNRSWHIYIRRLSNSNPSEAITHLDLNECALATSGDYFQYWTIKVDSGEEKHYCHIFNPRELKPLEIKLGSVASASLIAEDCVTADAFAKVLMLFDSPQDAQAWIENLQIDHPEMACWLITR